MGMPLAIVRNDHIVVWDVFLRLPNLKLFSNYWKLELPPILRYIPQQELRNEEKLMPDLLRS
jgi:hypothetical protein